MLRASFQCESPYPYFAVVAVLMFFVLVVSGCAAGAVNSSKQPAPGNTSITVMASSTANDRLAEFDMDLIGISLVDQSGNVATLLPSAEHVEFTHLNGSIEPLFSASIPEGTYTAATVSIGSSKFACASGNSSGTVSDATYAFEPYLAQSLITTTLPSQISVQGSSMNLILSLRASQSANVPSTCTSSPGYTPTLTPDFTLSASSGEEEPSLTGLEGTVSSVDSADGTVTIAAADGYDYTATPSNGNELASAPSWQVNANGQTVFQGVSGLSNLVTGMPVNFDASVQAEGSLAATRIHVEDTNSNSISFTAGPVLGVYKDLSPPAMVIMAQEETGSLWSTGNVLIGEVAFQYSGAQFQISGQLTNLQSLPFVATFTSENVVAGQYVATSSHAPSWGSAPNYPNLTTVTLLPQSLNGTVIGISSQGGFDVYTVSLAAYDLFPQLAAQTYQKTLLTSPGVVTVYADQNTKSLNSEPITVGSLMRFNGVVFDDQGNLRMDCLQITDGVAE